MKTQQYYNTTHQQGDVLREYENKAISQERVIASYFEANPGELFTPWEVRALAFSNINRPPITSVRRSMSNLTRVGILTKTSHRKNVGEYNRDSYSWILSKQDKAQGKPEEPIEMPLDGYIHNSKGGLKGAKNSLKKDDLFETIASATKPELIFIPAQLSIEGMQPAIEKITPIKCGVCGRPLSDPDSVRSGIGPVCYGKTSHTKRERYKGAVQYNGFGLWPSECDVDIQKVGEIYHILFTSKSGTSVTNATEELATGIMQANIENLTPGIALFYEHYKNNRGIDLVEYEWTTDKQGRFIAKRPTWTRVHDQEIYELFDIEYKK